MSDHEKPKFIQPPVITIDVTRRRQGGEGWLLSEHRREQQLEVIGCPKIKDGEKSGFFPSRFTRNGG